MKNLSDFLVTTPFKILAHLKTLSNENCIINATFGDNLSFLTAIIDIDEKKQTITIDCGPKEYLNRELLSQSSVSFKSERNGIKILFDGTGITRVGEAGHPALSMKIPEQMYWIQRRQFYRTRSPLSKNSYCSINFKNFGSGGVRGTIKFQLFDLSATGFAILSDTKELAEQLLPSTKFENCQLTLDNSKTYTISFVVRTNFAVNPSRADKGHRIGCEFINLSPPAESAFLRYMQNIQREMQRNFK
ncbi:MAG: flagellar brake protein [Methylococcales bacterium]|nr:flagellar brake protein [Methylococcales bacterium]